MITKHEHILALILLTISTVIKIWSIVTLYTIYMHTEELEHDMENKAPPKRAKANTHEPLD